MKKLSKISELKNFFEVPEELISFLEKADSDTECGRYEFGEKCFVNVLSTETKLFDESLLMEKHVKYVDVQFLLEGEERVYYTEKEDLTLQKPYDTQKDRSFYQYVPCESVDYKKGEAVVLYTNEAHLPGIAPKEVKTIKKAVAKVSAELSK